MNEKKNRDTVGISVTITMICLFCNQMTPWVDKAPTPPNPEVCFHSCQSLDKLSKLQQLVRSQLLRTNKEFL